MNSNPKDGSNGRNDDCLRADSGDDGSDWSMEREPMRHAEARAIMRTLALVTAPKAETRTPGEIRAQAELVRELGRMSYVPARRARR